MPDGVLSWRCYAAQYQQPASAQSSLVQPAADCDATMNREMGLLGGPLEKHTQKSRAATPGSRPISPVLALCGVTDCAEVVPLRSSVPACYAIQ